MLYSMIRNHDRKRVVKLRNQEHFIHMYNETENIGVRWSPTEKEGSCCSMFKVMT